MSSATMRKVPAKPVRPAQPRASAAALQATQTTADAVAALVGSLAEAPLGLLAGFAPRLRALADEIARAAPPGAAPELQSGTGLGVVLDPADGQRLLQAHAVATPIETWAGPVAGASGITASLGIARSTLASWQRAGAVVALLRGQRKYAYPIEQFVDARPVPGIADVLALAPDPRGAWLWLRQPNAALNGETPLAALKAGRKQAVLAAAADDLPIERDFR